MLQTQTHVDEKKNETKGAFFLLSLFVNVINNNNNVCSKHHKMVVFGRRISEITNQITDHRKIKKNEKEYKNK